LSRYRWDLKPPIPVDFTSFGTSYSPLLVQILYNRNLKNHEQAQKFIDADDNFSNDAALLPDIHLATERVYRAILSGEKIAVYGDFDADGITATALMVKGITNLGGDITPYIPSRLTEGHGLKIGPLEKLAQEGISLVITVDCGVTAIQEVKYASKIGLDIIITDHHNPLSELPPAVAVVNPKRSNSVYPFPYLAGVGVAFKFLQGLYHSVGRADYLDELLDLVAIGTIADLMPLSGENRYLVKKGLAVINDEPRPGLKKLIERASLKEGSLISDNISWGLAPRLNAASRLEHAMPSYRLLMSEDERETEQLADWLENKNGERQRLTSSFHIRAVDEIKTIEKLPLLLFICDEEYPAGLLGLVAGRLTDEFYHPSIVVHKGGQQSSGSCRSIPEFNIAAALEECAELFTYFGGHAQAAGFTLPTANLPRLREKLNAIAIRELEGAELIPHLEVDAEVRLSELTGDTYTHISQLAPFGRGNPSPIFLSRGVTVIGAQQMGGNGNHLKLKLKQGDTLWNGVAFRKGEALHDIMHQPVDFVYNLELDNWRGVETLRLNIVDFTPTVI
jgi:single-stranded-DNA-specific exonuclease